MFKTFQKISGLALLDDQGQVCFDFGAEEVRTLDANKLSKLDTETVWDFVNHVCVVVSLHSCFAYYLVFQGKYARASYRSNRDDTA